MTRRQWLLLAAVLVVVAIVAVLVGLALSSRQDTGTVPQEPPPGTPAAAVAELDPDVTPGPVPTPGPGATPVPTLPGAPVPEGQTDEEPEEEVWVEIARLEGASSGRGPSFELSGAPARVRFVMAGSNPALDVFVNPEGRTSFQEGGVPVIRATGAGSGQSLLTKGAGSYYLDVYSRNASWLVVVEERA